MKLNRTKNASRNISYGLLFNIYQLLMVFIVRTIMIKTIGIDYIGINSLFTSILQVLNLAELGVGSAIVYSMYKPIAEEDTETICALMNLYKKYYRIIGVIILIVGLGILPYISYFINGDIPNGINLYLIYLLNLMNTVSTYWLFAYKNSLFIAHQRSDVSNKVNLVVRTFQYVSQILVLVYLRNYYLYLIIFIISQITVNCLVAKQANSKFPAYVAKGNLPKKEIKKINKRVISLFTSKVGEIILSSSDTIVISSFLTINILSVYSNYGYIATSVLSIVSILFSSVLAGVGNALIVDTLENNKILFNKILFIVMWLAGIVCCLMLCLYQPFITFWIGNEYTIDFTLVIIIVVTQYIRIINQFYILYRDAAALWEKDRLRPFISTMFNLFLNIATVTFIGLYGVLLSTTFSILFVGFPLLMFKVNKYVFHAKKTENLLLLVQYAFVTFFSILIIYKVTSYIFIEGLPGLLLTGVVSFTLMNVSFIICYHKKSEYLYLKGLMLNLILKN